MNTHEQVCEANYNLFGDAPTSYSGINNTLITSSPFSDTATLQLSPCSVAVNAGDSLTTTQTVGMIDVVGSARFVNRIDIGALEYSATPFTLYTIRAGNWTDAGIWSCGRLPTLNDVVNLRHVVSIPSDSLVSVFRIIKSGGGLLTFDVGGRLQVGF